MRAKLMLVSMMTLGLLMSMVFFIVFLAAYWAGYFDFAVLIIITVVMNFVLWLLSPAITDLIQGWFYKLNKITFEEFKEAHPELADFLKEVCDKNKISLPRLRIILDANPTAYTYGSYPGNARVVISEGIFKYLDLPQQKAVLAHELGHICNRDFIIMSIATTLLQVLYELYYQLIRGGKRGSRRSSGKGGNAMVIVGILSYVFYIIGTYIVLFLSRTREYLADRFSVEHTGDPNALAEALMRIAYGIAIEEEGESTQRLLGSTRAMGIYDYKSAHEFGGTFKATDPQDKKYKEGLGKVLLFDMYSPWAFLSEIKSTHPLTGKRIRVLGRYAAAEKKNFFLDMEQIKSLGAALDHKRLYGEFKAGLAVLSLPYLALLGGGLMIWWDQQSYPLIFFFLGMAMIFKGLYKFPGTKGKAEPTTVFKLMQDPYASPLRGHYVELEGKVIGKAQAGSYFGEDMTMEDRSGGLIYLNYESIFPIFGNVIFGMSTAKELVNKQIQATGWFRRSAFQLIDLQNIEFAGQKIKSYAMFWELIVGFIMLAVGSFLMLKGFVML